MLQRSELNHSPNRKRQRSSARNLLIYSLPLLLLLLIGAIKNDTENFQAIEYWISFQNGPLVTLIKNNINAAYLLLAAAFPLAVVVNGVVVPRLTASALTFSAIYFYGSMRVLTTSPALGLKFFVAFALMVVIQFYLAALAGRGRDMIGIVNRALVTLSAILILLNLSEYVAGNGYVPGFPRFFGTSSHPNFLGVQMAVCSLFMLNASGGHSRMLRVLKLVLFFSGLVLLQATGSRTGLVIFAVGFIVLQAITIRPGKFLLVSLIGVAVLTLVLLAFGHGLWSSDVYDRGGVNTRTQSWTSLWDAVQNAPFFGLGEFPRNSENSLLRGWATLGLAYPLLFIVAMGSFCVQLMNFFGTATLKRAAAPVAVCCGLSAGAMLEGYLVDANSFALHAWFICLTAASIHLGSARQLVGSVAARSRDMVPRHRLQKPSAHASTYPDPYNNGTFQDHPVS